MLSYAMLCYGITKAREILGWEPKVKLEVRPAIRKSTHIRGQRLLKEGAPIYWKERLYLEGAHIRAHLRKERIPSCRCDQRPEPARASIARAPGHRRSSSDAGSSSYGCLGGAVAFLMWASLRSQDGLVKAVDYFRALIAQHSTAQHSTAQHSIAQHSTAQHSTAQHNTA